MSGFGALVRFVSVRHVVAAPVRSLLTLLGVALGVAMMVGMTASNQAVLRAFDEMTDRTAGKADLEVTGDESGVEQALIDEVAARPDLVAHAAGRIEQTTLVDTGQGTERVLVLGVDFLGDKEFLPFEAEGGADVIKDPLAFLNDPDALLVSESFATRNHLAVGSSVRMRTAVGMSEQHVESILKETGKTRAFGGQLVVLFLDAAQLAFDRKGRVDRIDLALRSGVTVEEAKPKIQAIVGARGHVDRPSGRTAQIAKMAQSFQVGLQMQGMIAMFVGVFLIYNAVSVSIAQRKREIGILRSVGVTRRRVTGVFLAEALLIGVVGGTIGVPLGGLIARAVVSQFAPSVSRFYENIAAPTPVITPGLAVTGGAMGLAATLVAAFVPALRASRNSPVEALRRDLHAVSGSRVPARLMAWVGFALGALALGMTKAPGSFAGFASLAVLLAASACMAPAFVRFLARPLAAMAERLLGIPGRLGVDNVARELGRSSLTTAALMLATSMSVTVASYAYSYEVTAMEWIEQSIPADVFVTMGSPLVDRNAIPFSPEVADRVRGVPGVDRVDLVRSMTIPTHDLRVELLSIGSEIYLGHVADKPYRRVIDGPDPLPKDALVHDPSVLISENFAARTGLRAGGVLSLPSPTGAHDFRIVAVVIDYSSDQGWMLMDRAWFTAFWKDARAEALEIYVRPGSDPSEVAAAIRGVLASGSDGGGMFVSTNASLKDEARHTIQQTFEVSRASEVVALVVAVLGVVGTMLAAVLDRTREIGVLRAIGARRRQVLQSVLVEAAFLGAAAAALGVLASLPGTWVFIKVVGVMATGWNVPIRVPVLAVVRVAGSIFLFAIAAGVLPGLRASRLEVTRALAYE